MIYYICAEANGQITNAGSVGGNLSAEEVTANIPGAILVNAPVDNQFDFYWDGLSVVRRPPRPSFSHEFDFTLKAWTITPAKAWANVRGVRNQLMTACDWTQLPDIPPATKSAWVTYRQSLRDITLQQDPLLISWPSLPLDN